MIKQPGTGTPGPVEKCDCRNQTTRTCTQRRGQRTNKVSAEEECADENGAVFVGYELTVADEVHKRQVPPGFPPGATHLRKEDDVRENFVGH